MTRLRVPSSITRRQNPEHHTDGRRTGSDGLGAGAAAGAGARHVAARRCGAWRGSVDESGTARGAGAVRVCRDSLRLSHLQFCHQRFLGALRGVEFQLGAAAGVSHRRGVGGARRFVVAVGADAGVVDGGGECVQPPFARRHRGARAGCAGSDQRRLFELHAVYLESVRPPVAGGNGRA